MATTKININELTQKLQNVFPMPQVLSKIMMTINDPNANAAAIEQVFKYEPSFTLKILTLANSSYYGSPGKVTNIRTAITLLGFNLIKSLAVHASVNELFHFGTSSSVFSGYDLWKHSVGVGVASKMISRRLKFGNAEDMFTVGILHDIGLIIEYQFYRDDFIGILSRLQEKDADIIAIEEDLLGTNHAELTKVLCEKWNMPEMLNQAVLYHHNPMDAPEAVRKIACILYVANKITHQKRFGFHYEGMHEIEQNVLCQLELEDVDLEVLAEDFDQEVTELSMFLD